MVNGYIAYVQICQTICTNMSKQFVKNKYRQMCRMTCSFAPLVVVSLVQSRDPETI